MLNVKKCKKIWHQIKVHNIHENCARKDGMGIDKGNWLMRVETAEGEQCSYIFMCLDRVYPTEKKIYHPLIHLSHYFLPPLRSPFPPFLHPHFYLQQG